MAHIPGKVRLASIDAAAGMKGKSMAGIACHNYLV